jgi:hypothetical protein
VTENLLKCTVLSVQSTESSIRAVILDSRRRSIPAAVFIDLIDPRGQGTPLVEPIILRIVQNLLGNYPNIPWEVGTFSIIS